MEGGGAPTYHQMEGDILRHCLILGRSLQDIGYVVGGGAAQRGCNRRNWLVGFRSVWLPDSLGFALLGNQ